MTTSRMDHRILRYIGQVESGEVLACREQYLLIELVKREFAKGEIYTDSEQLTKYLGLAKYFPYETLFTWEEFLIALHLCTYYKTNKRPRWPDLFMLIGRGAGKGNCLCRI